MVWQSTTDGRGEVTERVVAYQVRSGQTVEVEDPQITGTQTVTFTPQSDGCTVALELDYALRHPGLFAPVVDRLFVRRAFRDALRGTLARFRREAVAGSAETPSG